MNAVSDAASSAPQADRHDGNVRQQRSLQAQDGHQRRPISVAHAGAHADHRARPGRDGDHDRRQQKPEPGRQAHLRR